MKTLRHDDPHYSTALEKIERRALPHPQIEATVRKIVEAVRDEGDAALLEFTERFGGPRLTAAQLRVSETGEGSAAARNAMAASHANILAFARKSLRTNWNMKNAQGARVGERFDPFQRVGIYVPGGTAPLVSTALMTCTLAQAAGCPEIVVTTPSGADGRINGALLLALEIAGATEIYRVGGAQAIAALAFGTESIAPVQKIFGPGNAYVVEAKRQVVGAVAIDLLPGPSEILVIADSSANPAWVAADLLAQAEHGKGSLMMLVTNSAKLLAGVEKEIAAQMKVLARQEHLAGVLDDGATLVLVKSMKDAVVIANRFAPEHLSLVAKDEDKLAAQCVTAGAIFVGGYSPVAAGDFLAGPSHTLPTGGAGRSFPGLTADMFQRRTSVIQFDASSLRKAVPIIEAFSAMEGLDGHGRSASIRLGGKRDAETGGRKPDTGKRKVESANRDGRMGKKSAVRRQKK
ncbi:MAG: histidinol dehydrogenase [Chthoniobacteraceae bacterium]